MSLIATAPETEIVPDYSAIKAKQQIAWGSGDYSAVGSTLQIVGERLCEALDVRSGQRLLDVAAGNGNVSLAASRRYCEVVSTDYVQDLLERGKARAEADGLTLSFEKADVEDLPFGDETYDLVTSSFGVMFTPNQDQAAAEMLRVCKSGGKIGLANWTPAGFIGQLFKTIGSFVTPPAGLKSPALWGTEERLSEFFGAQAESIEITQQTYVWRYKSPEHWLNVWRELYGPLQKAFASMDAERQQHLADALIALIDRFNIADDGTMVVPGEYLEIVVTKR